MRKFYILAVFFALMIQCRIVSAQDMNSAEQRFQQFVVQRDGGNMGSAYNTLNSLCQSIDPLVNGLSEGSSDYGRLRSLLTSLMPDIDQAFSYFYSRGNNNNAFIFAQYYLKFEFSGVMRGVSLEHSSMYPTMVYNTAARTYNAKDYKNVITYFQAYLNTGEQKHRNDVLKFMFDACQRTKNYDAAVGIMDEVIQVSPNIVTVKSAINMCMAAGDYTKMQAYLSKAISMRPTDVDLQKLQGQLYEETGNYEQAIVVYEKLRSASPLSVDINKHLAVNQYNMAVSYYNAASEGVNTKRNSKLATDYFSESAKTLENVVKFEKNSLKYNQALASAYLYSDQQAKLEQANQQVLALGGVRIAPGDAPVAISTSSNNAVAQQTNFGGNSNSSANGNTSAIAQNSQSVSAASCPSFSEFAKTYVEEKIKKWQEKDPYETVDEYRKRVTAETRSAKAQELIAQAKQDYIAKYSAGIKFNKELKLCPYDAENGAFLIESAYGELVISVPRENNEARNFEKNWAGMTFNNAQYGISDDKLILTALTFVTPSGKTYQFSSDKDVSYTDTKVDVHFDDIDASQLAQTNTSGNTKRKRETNTVSVGMSDVDQDIPVNKENNEKTFAVVICNENYSNVTGVPMAINDGKVFADYCQKTLGLPSDNVRLYKDASYGVMLRAMRDIKSIADAYQGSNGLKVIFYYAGHGIPNESTKDAYLLPVDADGTQTDGCYSLTKLYEELGALGAEHVLVFLDACFSGAKRDGGMLASARGVALKPKKSDPRGNMVIFSAASDDETAMPYKEKGHGLFTYYLLKKLQESKGNVTLSELGNYITTNVKQKATVVNRKPQTPSVVPSTAMADSWTNIKLIK